MIRRLMAFLLLLPGPALAQAVHGTVTDADTGVRIPGVEVKVLDAAGRALFTSVADDSGRFELPLPTGGAARLHFTRIGYASVTSTPMTAGPEELLDLQVRLAAAAVPLDPITVVAKQREDERVADFRRRAARNRRLGLGNIWTRADLAKHPVIRVSQLLRRVPVRGDCTRSEVYVDGLSLAMRPPTGLGAARIEIRRGAWAADSAHPAAAASPAPAPESDASVVDWLVAPDDVEGVEIYREPDIPPQFNPDGDLCRVTLIWRRSYAEGSGIDFAGARKAAGVVAVGALLGWLFMRIR